MKTPLNDKRIGTPAKHGFVRFALTGLIGALLFLAACEKNNPTEPIKALPTADQFNAEVPVGWFSLQLKLVRETPGFSPPVASRAFGYAGVTLYEAIVSGMPKHQSLAGQLNQLASLPQCAADEEHHWPTVANSAMAVMIKKLFPNAGADNVAAIDSLEAKYSRMFQTQVSMNVFSRSVAQGKIIADAIYIWSLTDGGHEGHAKNLPIDYTPPTGPGLWAPTPPAYSRALQPYWGKNRCFVLNNADECASGTFPAYSEEASSAFYREAQEVYETGKNLTEEQRTIALFWADNPGETSTPPGHWIAIVNQLLEEKHYTLDVAAEAYAKVGLAVADAFIACWHKKFEYNLLRPVTYLNKVIDPAWKPLIPTPPFPEFVSGHSTQSSAVAQVLTDMFGDVRFTDRTHAGRGFSPRPFNSFFDAANEAALSRLYGGIHFRSGNEKGLELGKCIGKKVSALRFKRATSMVAQRGGLGRKHWRSFP